MGTAYRYGHAACLAAQLPAESRCARAVDPRAAWTAGEWMLRSIEHGVRVLAWMQTRDGERGRRRPRPVPAPGEREDAARRAAATDTAAIDAILGGAAVGG